MQSIVIPKDTSRVMSNTTQFYFMDIWNIYRLFTERYFNRLYERKYYLNTKANHVNRYSAMWAPTLTLSASWERGSKILKIFRDKPTNPTAKLAPTLTWPYYRSYPISNALRNSKNHYIYVYIYHSVVDRHFHIQTNKAYFTTI